MTLLFVNEYKAQYTLERMSKDKSWTGGVIGERTRRPRNAFILYRQEKQKILSKSNLHSKELSKIIAQMWKSEAESVRMKYERLAEVEKLKHTVTYPQYKYAPRQKKKLPVPVPVQERAPEAERNYSNLVAGQTKDISLNEYASNLGENRNHEQFADCQFDIESTASFIEQLFNLSAPSEILCDNQILPDGTELDLMPLENYYPYNYQFFS